MSIPTLSYAERAENVFQELRDRGYSSNDRFAISLDGAWTVSVRDKVRGTMVALSTAKADFEQSVEEFVLDYMV